MAKKKTVDYGFTPSEYQAKFFDFIQHGVGNAVIRATAGSGKTTSAVAAMKLIPKKQKCLFIAFNKSIAEELSERLKNNENVQARTAHSLGFLMLKRNIGSDIEVDEYKYRTFLKKNINDLTNLNDVNLTLKQANDYIESVSMLIDYSRFNLAQSIKEINEVALKYDIPINFDECEVTLKCLEWGKKHTETIDYTDMVWLPVELSLKPLGLQYDWIFVDECQDMSLMSIQLFLKCFKRGSRFVAIGDDSQMINLFAGSSEEAFKFMCEYPNTQLFELPISYRCAKKVVELANAFVPMMQAREDAPEGIILNNCKTNVFKDGDMVLSRSKSPLLKLYVKLLRKGVNCYIKGQDIGLNLIKLLETTDINELNCDLKNDGVFVRLYDNLFNERNKLMNKRGLDYKDATLSSVIMEKYDTINALSVLAEKFKTKTELIENIKKIFQENSKGVCLSTVHKAKGLEADNVYILCHSSMPSKLAHHEWEKTQEKNLIYVAYTRAKKTLGFISEKEIPPSGSSQEPTEIINELNFIENQVCKILGKEPIEKMELSEISRFKLKTATVIDDVPKGNVIDNNYKTINSKDEKDLLKELESMFN